MKTDKEKVAREYLSQFADNNVNRGKTTFMPEREGKTVLSFTDEIGYTEFRVNNEWLNRMRTENPGITNDKLLMLATTDDTSDVDC